MASSATVSAPKKRKSFSEYFHSMRGQQLIVTLVFLFVPLVLLFMFTYLPFFKMVEFSFFKMKYIGRRTFVGLQNYISVFTRKDCFHALSLSLYYMVGSVVQMALALLFWYPRCWRRKPRCRCSSPTRPSPRWAPTISGCSSPPTWLQAPWSWASRSCKRSDKAARRRSSRSRDPWLCSSHSC